MRAEDVLDQLNFPAFQNAMLVGSGVAYYCAPESARYVDGEELKGMPLATSIVDWRTSDVPPEDTPGVMVAYADETEARMEAFGRRVYRVEYARAVSAAHVHGEDAVNSVVIVTTDIKGFELLPEPEFQGSPEQLSNALIDRDRQDREARSARHEAGHAACAWLLGGDLALPPFEYVELKTIEEQQGGIIPGSTALDREWFDSLSSHERGAILLAGVYVQDGHREYSPQEWLCVVEALEGADATDDLLRAHTEADEAGVERNEFLEDARQTLEAMGPELHPLVDIVAGCIRPGHRTFARQLVEAVEALRSPV